jgi:hypothetical protein
MFNTESIITYSGVMYWFDTIIFPTWSVFVNAYYSSNMPISWHPGLQEHVQF